MASFSVSFGKKIFLTNCLIKNVLTNSTELASIVQFDCQDISDIDKVKNTPGFWQYKDDIINSMNHTFKTKDLITSAYSFYAIENSDNEIVGLAQTKSIGKDLVLDFLESENNKRYKFIGQNLINFLSQRALSEKYDRLYIPSPTESARKFYIDKCLFKNIPNSSAVEINKRGLKKKMKSIRRLDIYS